MERLFGAIPSVLKDLGGGAVMSEAVVFAAWKQCAGELLSERTAAIEYFEKRLVVAVQDANWRAHLEDLSPRMIARINTILEPGSVKFIEFRIDASAFKERMVKAIPFDEVTRVEVPQTLSEAADAIGDEGLRKTFLDAASIYLQTNNGR